MARSPSLKELRPRDRMEFDPDSGLTPLAHEVIALLVEGDLTIDEICQHVGWSPQTIWRMRKKPEFQAEYRRQLALVESTAYDLAISRRRERVAALNELWRKLRDELARAKKLRTDQIYALIALQQAAAKELGLDATRVEVGGRLEISQAVQVIRFEATPLQAEAAGVPAELPESTPIDAEFAATPNPNIEFSAALAKAGARIDKGVVQPEELAAIRAAVAQRGLDPVKVLTDAQFRAVYGREKGADPWTI